MLHPTPEYTLLPRGDWTSYSVADGLPGFRFEHVAQDAEGLLWFGSFTGGICAFDGSTFRTFTRADGLSGNEVFAALLDRGGRLWVGTRDGGLCWYADGRFHRLDDALARRSSLCLFEDSAGRIWSGGAHPGQVGYVDAGTFVAVLADDPWDGGTSAGCWGIAEDRAGHIWASFSGCLLRWDGDRLHTMARDPTARYVVGADGHGAIWLAENRRIGRWEAGRLRVEHTALGEVRKIQHDGRGATWFATTNGVVVHDAQGFRGYSTDDGLSFPLVNGILRDREGIVWFATWGGGICSCDFDGAVPLEMSATDPAAPGARFDDLQRLLEDRAGRLWAIGSLSRRGGTSTSSLVTCDGNQVIHWGPEAGLEVSWRMALHQDALGTIWAGGKGGLFRGDGMRFERVPLSEPGDAVVTAIGEDTQGRLYVGYADRESAARRAGVLRLDGAVQEVLYAHESSGQQSTVAAIEPGAGDRVWIAFGNADGSPSNLSLVEWRGDRVPQVYADALQHASVAAVAAEGEALLAATQHGLVRIADGSCRWLLGGPDQGHPPLYDLHRDQEGFWWLASEVGVMRYNGDVCQLLRSAHVGPTRCIVESPDGQLWFGTATGLVRYRSNPVPPRVRVVQVLADEVYPGTADIETHRPAPQVVFEYRGTSFRTHPDAMLYTYRLDGHDESWSPPASAQRAYYHDLPPGQYTFRVRAIDRDLNPSEAAHVSLVVGVDPRDEQIGTLEREAADRERRLADEVSQRRRLAGRLSMISADESRFWGLDEFVGHSGRLQRILGAVGRLPQATIPVLITGESGTGKELIARALHAMGASSEGPFVPVNCSAIPDELAESLFFGHVRGAFTGAESDRLGYFELAHGGTLFLDEIGDMPADLQAKLLRVLEDGRVLPVGAREEKQFEVRILAATNNDMVERVRSGRFREDLYFRLARFALRVPPLRERRDDIPVLARHFLRVFAEEMRMPLPSLTPAALRVLEDYPFPGNVRELKNVVERALLECDGGDIEPQHLHLSFAGVQPAADDAHAPRISEDLPLDLAKAEAILIGRALEQTGGNITQAARLLGVNRHKIYRKLAIAARE